MFFAVNKNKIRKGFHYDSDITSVPPTSFLTELFQNSKTEDLFEGKFSLF